MSEKSSGGPSIGLLLFSYGDVQKIKYFIRQKDGDEQRIAQMHMKALLDYADSDICRRIPLLTYFGEAFEGENCGNCDNCQEAEGREDTAAGTRREVA